MLVEELGIDAALIWVRQFLELFEPYPINEDDALEAGRILVKHNVPVADALIAAVARRFKAAVVTDDEHFARTGVQVAWYKARATPQGSPVRIIGEVL